MKFAIFILALSLSISFSLASDCSNDPANWCLNVENAKACGLVEHCWKYVWSKKNFNSDYVNFTLYYETLCPDCRQFMTGQLAKAVEAVGSIMNLTLVPYGNAKETYRSETKLWQFSCQHGSDECWGNLLHSCLIYYYPKTEDHFPFIHCMEANNDDNIKTAATKCGQQFNITMDQLNKCMTSRLGNNLQHSNAVLTDILNPPHKYVPWVTLNGVHTEDIEQQAESNLISLVCNAYKGQNKPAACNELITKRKSLNF